MKKILVIEDEVMVREGLVELLSAEGYLPISARDGEEGVRLAWETLPDLILCDIMMPRLDGFGVLSRLSRDAATATIPFIFLTARTERDDIRLGMSLGADDYIMKPFSIDDVLHAIKTGLEKLEMIEEQVQNKMVELSKSVRLSLPAQMLNRLSIILSYSEMLSNCQEIAHQNASQICMMGQEIHRAANSLLRSIQNYSLYTELEAIQADVNRIQALRDSRVPSVEVAISEMALLKARQDGREDDLRLRIQDASVQMAEAYLQKIIEELLENAFQYSQAGSRVEISGEIQPNRQQYLLRVTDYGRGMTQEQVTALSGRLHPGDLSTYPHGIGLAVVRRLTELHRGRFSVQSQPNEWTTVEISIPLAG